MPRPRTRYMERNNQFIRQWRVLIALRSGPKSLENLAETLGCHPRTIRRDIYALQAAGLPVTSRFPANEGVDPWPLQGRPMLRRGCYETNTWFLAGMAEWPRDEATPVAEIA